MRATPKQEQVKVTLEVFQDKDALNDNCQLIIILAIIRLVKYSAN